MPKIHIDLPGADVDLYPFPNLGDDPEYIFQRLLSDTPWEQRYLTIKGIKIPEPRKTAWYGEGRYTYSGITWEPLPMTSLLSRLQKLMTHLSGAVFNSVLLNLYTDGKSSIGMHSDDEPELGPCPVIASLSLGATRRFDFKAKDGLSKMVSIPLESGSILIMKGRTQDLYKHGIAKIKDDIGPRINLTFRNIITRKDI